MRTTMNNKNEHARCSSADHELMRNMGGIVRDMHPSGGEKHRFCPEVQWECSNDEANSNMHCEASRLHAVGRLGVTQCDEDSIFELLYDEVDHLRDR